MTDPSLPRRDEAFWYDFLTRGDSREHKGRMLLKRLPHGPRCKLCAAPFAGAGGRVMRMIGKRPSEMNPAMCSSCFDFMTSHHGGAEINCTILFADIRGSTSMAEGMSAAEFRGRLDRFYTTASAVVFDHDGMIDKFVGDEVMALFFPLLSGDRHAAEGIEAGRGILAATGHADRGGPWVPVGVGVHTGRAWVGAVGDETHTELTAVGDIVNTTARLATVAGPGEVLVSAEAARDAGLDAGLPRRSLELKGKESPTEVVSLRIG